MLRDLLVYGHPLVGTVSLVFAFWVFRDGFAQRRLRLSRVPAPPSSRLRHVERGPWSVVLMGSSALLGLTSAIALRDWRPLATFHGKVGLTTTLMFAVMWWLGRRLVAGEKHLAGTHGVLGLLALFAGGLTGLLGISLLP